MNLQEFKKKLLKNPEFAKEYYKKDLAFDIGNMVIEARISRGITQVQLAKTVGTKQPGIARLERGESLPSISLLDKVAKALDTNLSVFFSKIPYVVDVVETANNNLILGDEKIYTKFNAVSFSETNFVVNLSK